MTNDFYVYCYFHPTGEPCYVGKGRGERWKAHLTKSACTNSHLRRIVAKAGGDIPHVKIHVGLSNDKATEFEIALIGAIGRYPNGPLVNKTDGGEGIVGISDDTREKLRQKARARKWSNEQRAMLSAAHIGKPQDSAVVAKRANSNRGKTRTLETREKMSAAMKGLKRSPEGRANISAAHKGLSPPNKGKPMSEEQRQKLRKAWVRRKAKKAA